MPQSNDQSYCTCPNVACPRHGDCKACVLYHREDQFDLVFIILDKMDKIGWDGVKAELVEAMLAEDERLKKEEEA